MTRKVVRKASLVAHVCECFFGFADSVGEMQFLKQQVQQRTRVMMVLLVAGLASSIRKVLLSDDLHSLDPRLGTPLFTLDPRLMTLYPSPLMCARVYIFSVWIMCDPASIPSVVQRLEAPTSSLGSWCGFSLMISVVIYLFIPRAKLALVQTLLWLVLAPYVAQRSPGNIPPWPPVLTLTITMLLRLHGELRARSQFKDQYYLSTDSTETTKTPGIADSTETTETNKTTDSTETSKTTKTTNSTETERPAPEEQPAGCLMGEKILVLSQEGNYPPTTKSQLPALVDESQVPALVDKSQLPALVDESQLPALVDESQLPALVDESQLPALVDEPRGPRAVMACPVEEPRGCSLVRAPRGEEILGLSQEGNGSTSLATVLPRGGEKLGLSQEGYGSTSLATVLPRGEEIIGLSQEGNGSSSQATVLPQQASKSSLFAHFCEKLFSSAGSAKEEQSMSELIQPAAAK
eukprot:gene20598-27397_t